MTLLVLSSLSILCYLLAIFSIASTVFLNREFIKYRTLMAFSWLGLFFHIYLLSQQALVIRDVNIVFDMSVFNALSITSILMLCIIFPDLKKHFDIALITLPSSILIILLSVFFQTYHSSSIKYSAMLGIHVATSMAAYAILSLAATQAFFLYLKNRILKQHGNFKISLLFRKLPALMQMEKFLFKLLSIGFILLSFSLIAGLSFFDVWFSKHFIHKSVLSIAAWMIFGGLLSARYMFGLRGKKAVKWTLIAFTVLIVGFTGTKLIQELIINNLRV